MLTALTRAFAALVVPVLKPLMDALADEWGRDDEDEVAEVRAHPIGFRKPGDDSEDD